MADFASLPSHNLQYPVTHFAPIPERRTIPTAEYAAQLSKTLSNVAADLSPEERRRKQAELDLLGARVRESNLSNELRQLQINQLHQHVQETNQTNERLKSLFGARNAVTDKSAGTFEPKPLGFPTTPVADYYGNKGDTELVESAPIESSDAIVPEEEPLTP